MALVPLPTLRQMRRAEQCERLVTAAHAAMDDGRPDVALTELVAAVKVAYGLCEVPADLRWLLDGLVRQHGGFRS